MITEKDQTRLMILKQGVALGLFAVLGGFVGNLGSVNVNQEKAARVTYCLDQQPHARIVDSLTQICLSSTSGMPEGIKGSAITDDIPVGTSMDDLAKIGNHYRTTRHTDWGTGLGILVGGVAGVVGAWSLKIGQRPRRESPYSANTKFDNLMSTADISLPPLPASTSEPLSGATAVSFIPQQAESGATASEIPAVEIPPQFSGVGATAVAPTEQSR
jgi:hypothetical protein